MSFKKKNLVLLFIVVMFCVSSTMSNAQSAQLKKITPSTYTIRYPNQVKQLLKQMNPQEMWTNLTVLTSFPDRSADTQSGIDAAMWIKKQVETLINESGRNDIKVFTVETKGLEWGSAPFASDQPSVILQIGNSSNSGIVVGAHMDTHPKCKDEDTWCKDKGNMSGANDDGSGTVAVLALAKTLISSGMHFTKPIYLIWYAAEERGLWGSQAVIADFEKRKISISCLMQLDQIAYARNNDLTMYLASDKNLSPGEHAHTDQELTLFSKVLVEQYIGRPVDLSCQGGSDEEAWTDIAHVKAVRPLEADYCDSSHMYHDMHSPRDTIEKLSLTHMTDYLKLAIAFVVEMAEPTAS